MPAANPMAEVFSLGGEGNVKAGPAQARVSGGVGVDEHHVSAGILLVALALLVLLWQSKFRFNMTVGGG